MAIRYHESIAMGEQWAAVQGILGQSPDEFAVTLTDECRDSCDFGDCPILVVATEAGAGEYVELAVACRACVKTCFEARLADIRDYADDVMLNHTLACHAQETADGDPAAYRAAASALEEPKRPSLFAALRRQHRRRSSQPVHVTKPDVQSRQFRGRSVQNLDPRTVADYL